MFIRRPEACLPVAFTRRCCAACLPSQAEELDDEMEELIHQKCK
jgi:hypothetical protein